MPFGLGRKKDQPSPEPGPEHTVGWDALMAVFDAAFPGQGEHHWKPNDVPLPAQDGVWGISGYRDGATCATMSHRLFDHPSARAAFLGWLRERRGIAALSAVQETAEDPYDRLARQLTAALDWAVLEPMLTGRSP